MIVGEDPVVVTTVLDLIALPVKPSLGPPSAEETRLSNQDDPSPGDGKLVAFIKAAAPVLAAMVTAAADAVDLLGQPPFEAAQAGIDLGAWDAQLQRAQGGRENRVRIAGENDQIGALDVDHPFHALHRPGHLGRVATRADSERIVGLGNSKLAAKGAERLPVALPPATRMGKPTLTSADTPRYQRNPISMGKRLRKRAVSKPVLTCTDALMTGIRVEMACGSGSP
jgi:hypothetical protein